MANLKPLEQIKLEIDILSLDIDNMQNNEEKVTAVQHLEEQLAKLKGGNSGSPEPGVTRPAKRLKLESVEVEQETCQALTDNPARSGEIVNNPVRGLYNGLVPTCTQCWDSFQSLGLLDSHMKKVHPGLPKSGYQPGPTEDVSFMCNQCDFVTKRKDNFKNHFSIHTGEFRCHTCNMNLAGRTALEKHKLTRSHEERERAKCEEKEEKPGPSMTLSCKKCDFMTSSVEELLSHSNNCRKASSGSFEVKTETESEVSLQQASQSSKLRCEICDVTFSRESNLRRHNERIQHKTRLKEAQAARGVKRRKEETERSDTSEVWGSDGNWKNKDSGELSELSEVKTDIHEELIIDEKEYGDLREQDSSRMAMFTCPNCNQGFAKKERLDNHLKNPNNCEKLLKVRENLKMSQSHHQPGHLVIKPEFLGEVEHIQLNEVLQFQDATMLKCEHCEESFKNVRSLRKHLISHTNRHKCQTCNLGFSDRQRLEKHLSNPENCGKLRKLRDRKRRESATSNPEGSSSDNQDCVQVDPEELVIENEGFEEQEEEIEVFQCDQCWKYFSSKSSLRTHMVSHTDRYQCPNCEQGFSKKRHLETHIKSPTNCEKLMKARNLEVEIVDAREFVEAVISDEESPPGSPIPLLDNKYPDIIIEAKRSTGII